MAFVNERIPPVDLVKYRIEEIDKRYVVGGTSARSWTIDRERGVYIREVAIGREDSLGLQTWTLAWEGNLIEVKTALLGLQCSEDGHVEGRYRLLHIDLADDLLERRDEVVAAFREALTAFKDAGVYSTAKAYALKLEV